MSSIGGKLDETLLVPGTLLICLAYMNADLHLYDRDERGFTMLMPSSL